jgi:flagella basal body P-ring formation protein FlgA
MGLPLFRSDLIEPLQVQRGDMVDVTAISGSAQLHLPALAETPGRQGDMISLKNPHSGKIFRARVEGKDRALVMTWPPSEPSMSGETSPWPTRVQ